MKPQTRYQYEKRIRELEDRVRKAEGRAYEYSEVCTAIHNAIIELGAKGDTVCRFWMLRQFRRLWR